MPSPDGGHGSPLAHKSPHRSAPLKRLYIDSLVLFPGLILQFTILLLLKYYFGVDVEMYVSPVHHSLTPHGAVPRRRPRQPPRVQVLTTQHPRRSCVL